MLLDAICGVARSSSDTAAAIASRGAAHGSLFSYCVGQLGMSEDEACRRIELARLARRFPLLFEELASGRISLSVALLLKPVLTPDNHAELIAAARGGSLRTVREMLAARFPSPDVPSRIRKLPERLVVNAIPAGGAGVAHSIPAGGVNVANALPAAVAGFVRGQVTTTGDTAEVTTAPARTSFRRPPELPELELRSRAEGHAQSSLQDCPPPTERSHAPVQVG